jgi:DNA-binding Lrp family transcriptional regulator
MTRVDETNLQILRLLQEDGRMTVADLARAVGRSESTVRERVGSLEQGGFLQGYRAQVDWAKAGLPATAVVRARCDIGRVAEAAKALAKMPNVTRALLTTGPRPVLVHLRVRDIQHLQALLRDHLGDGTFTDVEAELALETLVAPRPPAFLAPATNLLAAQERAGPPPTGPTAARLGLSPPPTNGLHGPR